MCLSAQFVSVYSIGRHGWRLSSTAISLLKVLKLNCARQPRSTRHSKAVHLPQVGTWFADVSFLAPRKRQSHLRISSPLRLRQRFLKDNQHPERPLNDNRPQFSPSSIARSGCSLHPTPYVCSLAREGSECKRNRHKHLESVSSGPSVTRNGRVVCGEEAQVLPFALP